MIEEEVVRVVVVAKLLVAPEQDHAQVVVKTETAPECGQVRAAISFLENLKKKIVEIDSYHLKNIFDLKGDNCINKNRNV